MQLPLQVTFRNMEATPMVQEWIEEQASRLESLYQSITRCRVAVEAPHQHHKKGAQYHVRIDLTLPGGEIVIKRQPSARGRAIHEGKVAITKELEVGVPHKNLRQAINDAFRAAGRRLQDYARRQRGLIKAHEPAPIGRVSRLVADEGYGFLTTLDGREIYFHRDSVLNRGFGRLKVGSTVAFAEKAGNEGPQASTVRIVRKSGMRREVAAAAS